MNKQLLFTKVGYVYLPTNDMEKSILWYTENLGLELKEKFKDQGSFIAVLNYPYKDSVDIILVETVDQRPLEIMRNGSKHSVLSMNCLDIEHTHKLLKEKGVAVENIQTVGEDKIKYFYFKDDQGNLLEASWSKQYTIDDLDDIKEAIYM